MKKNKYKYLKVIQQHYGGCYGWEDASHYETDSTGYMGPEDRQLFQYDLAEYKLMGYPTRVIKRKELNA